MTAQQVLQSEQGRYTIPVAVGLTRVGPGRVRRDMGKWLLLRIGLVHGGSNVGDKGWKGGERDGEMDNRAR